MYFGWAGRQFFLSNVCSDNSYSECLYVFYDFSYPFLLLSLNLFFFTSISI